MVSVSLRSQPCEAMLRFEDVEMASIKHVEVLVAAAAAVNLVEGEVAVDLSEVR